MDNPNNNPALKIADLKEGRHYSCMLAKGRRVLYIGGGRIKWFSDQEDNYKTSSVHDYQLKRPE